MRLHILAVLTFSKPYDYGINDQISDEDGGWNDHSQKKDPGTFVGLKKIHDLRSAGQGEILNVRLICQGEHR